MPAVLKDRQRQIPNGLKFYQPETGWKAPRYASFNTLVTQVMAHRRGNLALAQKYNWNMARADVEREVDQFNAKHCLTMGWNEYVNLTGEDAPVPKFTPPQRGRNAAGVDFSGGAAALIEMFGEGGRPVASALATTRAAICVSCPKNEQGDWTRFFTEPASLLIRKMLGIVKDLELTTPHDAKLQICGVCYCPLKTKVWANRSHILRHLKPELQAQLPGHCWIRNEK